MDEEDGVAVAETSPASDPSATSPATSQPAQPAEPPFHQHPRFQQLIRQGQESRQTIEGLQRQLKEFQDKQDQAGRPVRAPQEAFERQQAGEALRELMSEHPELKNLLSLAKQAPDFAQMSETTQALQAQHIENLAKSGVSTIASLAEKAGMLPADPAGRQQAINIYDTLIAGLIRGSKDATQAYFSGRASEVVEAAWKALSTMQGHLRRQDQVALAATKQKVATLAPPLRGSAVPGVPAPKPVTPENAKEVTREMHGVMRRLLAQARTATEG